MQKRLCSLIIILILSSINSASAEVSVDIFKDISQIKSSDSCFSGVVENYDSWINFIESKNKNFNRLKFQISFPENKFKHYKATLMCYFFTYEVGDQIVDGFFIAPRQSKNLPVIIVNRGGSGTFGNMKFATLFSQVFYMADVGYAIIGSQYRGGTKRSIQNGGKDQWGGEDVKDVEALFGIIDQIKNIDSNRIGMYAGSRGSVNMFRVAKNTRRVKAYVSAAGVYDLTHELNFRPAMEKVYSKYIPDYSSNKTVEFDKRSVIKWADKLDLNAPILLMHSSYDKRASATGALKFSLRLQDLSHRYSLILFEADNHFFSDHQKQKSRATIEWFNKYLL